MTSLEELSAQIVGSEQKLADLDSSVVIARSEADRLRDLGNRLRSVEPPDRLEELETLANRARDDLADRTAALQIAEAALVTRRDLMADLPGVSDIERFKTAHEELAEIEKTIAKHDLAGLRKTAAEALAAHDESTAHLVTTRNDLRIGQVSHTAHALVADLSVGQPCPVCCHVVESIPSTDAPPELVGLQEEEKLAVARVDRARQVLDAANTAVTKTEAMRSSEDAQREKLKQAIEEIPNLDDIEKIVEQREAVSVLVDDHVKSVETLANSVKQAQESLDDLSETLRRLDKTLTSAQLTVAELGPPVSESDDVIVRWKDMIVWRDRTLEDIVGAMADAEHIVTERQNQAVEDRKSLEEALRVLAVTPVAPYAVQVAAELERARSLVEKHERAAVESVRLSTEIKESETEANVADALSNHLKANGFEQWLMVGALADLVVGANDLLSQLSSGGYSLRSDDDGSFSIVDHRNADEVRSVSTLSGGETFLVSLALALSLAETLAVAGGARLDTIILDEGFGTLDEESLDIVATVLEELAGEGLMVGVITHVKELALRAPTRFEVQGLPTGSVVEVVS